MEAVATAAAEAGVASIVINYKYLTSPRSGSSQRRFSRSVSCSYRSDDNNVIRLRRRLKLLQQLKQLPKAVYTYYYRC